MSVSRRKFVKTASAAVALTTIGTRADALVPAPEVLRHVRGRAEDYKALVQKGVDENDKILIEGLRKVRDGAVVEADFKKPSDVLAHLEVPAE